MTETEPAAARFLGSGTERYLLLLGALVALLLVASLVGSAGIGGVAVVVVVWAVVLSAARAVGVRSTVWRRILVVATLGLLLAIPAVLSATREFGSAVFVLLAAGMLAGSVMIIRRIVEYRTVTIRLVVAALCAYLQVGYGFGFLYRAMDLASDVPFFSEGRMAGLFEYLYFSFITLTTVGYGDLTPARDLGRSLVILEALLGQVLLVVLVAYLVGNLARERHGPTE